MKHFQFQTMQMFYFVFKTTKTLCKRCITNDTSPTPTCMATIGTKGCQTVRVHSVNKQRLLYKNSAYYETTIRPSVSVYMCTTGKLKVEDFFRFFCHYLTLIHVWM